MEGKLENRYAERSASFIGLILLAGRLLERAGAFGQVLLIAAVLGSTTRADLYFIVSIVPLALGNVVGEALSAATLARAARETDPRAAVGLFSAGFWVTGVLLGVLTAIYLAILAVLVPTTTPAGTTSMLPWLAFAPVGLFFGLATYCAAPLLHFERYVWPALRTAASTIVGLVLTAVTLALGGGVVWIGLSVSAGYGVALLLLVGEILSIGRRSVLALPGRWAVGEIAGLRRKVAGSVTSGVIGGQVFVLLERVLAAPLGVGAVASISYARGVAFTPAVLGQAIGAGVYPSLLRAHAADAAGYVRERFVSGLRLTLFVTVVSGAYLALYSPEIADALFNRGAVTPHSLHTVEQCLTAFSLAVLGWMLTIYSSRVFGALNLFSGLVIQELVALAVYLTVALPLRSASGVEGVALAFALAQVAGGLAAVAFIASRLHLRLVALGVEAVIPAIVRGAPVVASAGAVRILLVHGTDAPSAFIAGAGGLTVAAGTVAVLWASRWPELDSTRAFVRRIRRASPSPQ